MDAKLREAHLSTITDESVIRLYDELCADFERINGGMTPSAQHIIGDIAIMEQTKRMLNEDISECGVKVLFKNGRQQFIQENKSIQGMRALAEQQRRHLNG